MYRWTSIPKIPKGVLMIPAIWFVIFFYCDRINVQKEEDILSWLSLRLRFIIIDVVITHIQHITLYLLLSNILIIIKKNRELDYGEYK